MMSDALFNTLVALLIIGGVIFFLIAAAYAIISDAKASGIRAARGESVTWKKLLKKPGALILTLFFAVIVGVLLFPFMGLISFLFLWIVDSILREYFKQKELKRIRKEKTG